MATLWIRSGLGWPPERDFGATQQLCQVGARFQACDELVFMTASEFLGIYLQPKQSHLSIVSYVNSRPLPDARYASNTYQVMILWLAFKWYPNHVPTSSLRK